MRPRVLATLLTLILALALGAGGPLRAFAHDGEAGLRTMVICSEDGARTVHLDAAGNPVDPDKACLADPCDDCLPSGPATIGGLGALPVPPDHARALAPQPDPGRPATRRTGLAQARGPPAGGDRS